MTEWITIRENAHPRVMERMLGNLRQAGLTAEGQGRDVCIRADKAVQQAWELVGELLRCHKTILELADPDKRKPYKPLEPDRLVAGAWVAVQQHPDRSPAFVACLLHEFVWSQGLPNTNHRSAILLADRLLFTHLEKPSEVQLSTCRKPFWEASKPLIEEREYSPRPEPLKNQHLRAAKTYVDCVLNQAS